MSVESSIADPVPRIFSKENFRGFFNRQRIVVILLIFIIQAAGYFVIPSLPFLQGEEQVYSSQSKQIAGLVAASTPVDLFFTIFFHNLELALLMVVPAFGIILFSYITYATARVIQAIAVSATAQPVPPLVVSLALFFFPHAWIELAAYPAAVAESLFLIYYVLKFAFLSVTHRDRALTRRRLRLELGYTVLTLLAIAVALLVAAVFETVEISTAPYELLTWLPFLGLLGLFVIWLRRVTRSPATPTQPL